ncbi:MAG: TetR family transcriptional regulator [Rhodococcus sp. (in: high G+C Gram-positive bacteria)]
MPANEEPRRSDRAQSPSAAADSFRLGVMGAALELFESKGYDATTVDQIAESAGLSRRTFFRQFRSKEDVVFVDHDATLDHVREFLGTTDLDAHDAVCEAAAQVFARFSGTPDTTQRRYRVLQTVPALRERELVMVLRYERVFVDTLRRGTADEDPLASVQFAAAVTATHNYLLRHWLRDGAEVSVKDVRAALTAVRRRFTDVTTNPEQPTVAVLPPGTSVADVTALLAEHYGSSVTTTP